MQLPQEFAAAIGSQSARLSVSLPPTFDSMEEERRYRKQQLAAGFRLFGRFGFSEGFAGHITVRDPEHTDQFWVNPFGMSFRSITASDLILVDHNGTVVFGDALVNRAAFVIHSRIHLQRPDVIAAAHSHSLYGKAFSALGIELAAITQDACAFYRDHGLYTEYQGVVDDLEEGDRIGAALGDRKAAILQNHGLLTVGQSVAEAVWWFITMERSCQAQLLAMAAGPLKLIDPTIALRNREQVGTTLAGWFQAQPLFAEIMRSEPDLLN
ncbi:class II aldolase/adducin family protein [Nocardia fluminea]|uniref:class II aldolase/adducin family protein n=1 Tax=Nocardia fluminea TaxID=134984 RepID=UPI003F4DA4F9